MPSDLDLLLLQDPGQLFGRSGDALALDGVAVAVLAFPGVSGHGPSFPPRLSLRARATAEADVRASRRWMMSVSSSGKEVTDMAVSRVISLRK